MRKASTGLGLGLPLMLLIWYFASVWWAPMDAVTIALPQRVTCGDMENAKIHRGPR